MSLGIGRTAIADQIVQLFEQIATTAQSEFATPGTTFAELAREILVRFRAPDRMMLKRSIKENKRVAAGSATIAAEPLARCVPALSDRRCAMRSAPRRNPRSYYAQLGSTLPLPAPRITDTILKTLPSPPRGSYSKIARLSWQSSRAMNRPRPVPPLRPVKTVRKYGRPREDRFPAPDRRLREKADCWDSSGRA